MECTPKCVMCDKSYSHRKMRSVFCKPKTQHETATIQLSSCSKCCPLSRMRVLSLRRHWSTALSTTLCF